MNIDYGVKDCWAWMIVVLFLNIIQENILVVFLLFWTCKIIFIWNLFELLMLWCVLGRGSSYVFVWMWFNFALIFSSRCDYLKIQIWIHFILHTKKNKTRRRI